MSIWSSFPFARLVLAWILGILMAYYELIHSSIALWVLLIAFLSYSLLVWLLPKTLYDAMNPLLGFLGISCICLLGYFCLRLHQTDHHPSHISRQKQPIEAYVAVVQEPVQKKEDRWNVLVSLQKGRIAGNWKPMQGKMKLFIQPPSSDPIQVGDVLLVVGKPQPIQGPRNPNEFNQKTYLSHQNITHQHWMKACDVKCLRNIPPSYMQNIFRLLRDYTYAVLTHAIHNNQARAIVLALVLGNKDALNEELKTAYGAAGTMHVLAVSGLHVGIIYGILRLLLRWLSRRGFHKWLQGILTVSCLWAYAIITGLAPSVLRATFMFTLVAIAQLLNKKNAIYNSLASSAFLLLLFDPFLIFSVGFQLSYLAVLGILYLQPKIAGWFQCKNKLLNYLWISSSVSLAAQIATTPISIYYFHQFPMYFLLANWIVVPAAFVVLTLGIAVLITSWYPWLHMKLAWLLATITGWMNQTVLWISGWPGSVLENIYIDAIQLLLTYALLIGILIFLQRKKFQYLLISSLVALCWCGWSMKQIIQQKNQQGIIYYTIKQHTVVSLIDGMHSWLIMDEAWPDYDQKYHYHIQPSQLARGIHRPITYTYDEADKQTNFPWTIWKGLKIGIWKQKTIIIIDQASVSHLASLPVIKTDWLVIEQNAVKDLQVLLKKFQFDCLIIGHTNRPQLVTQLKQQADELHIKIHVLQQQGAFCCFW